jgi:serine/threonine protein kinase
MARQEEIRIGDWLRCVSKSTGNFYYFNSIEKQSLWEDQSLPYGWGWKKSSDTSPKIFVNLITGEETEKVPSGIKRNREDREEEEEEEEEEDISLTSNDITNVLEQELQKYFNVSTIEALCIAGRGKRSAVYRSIDRNIEKGDKKEDESRINKFTLKVQPFDDRVAEEIEALKDASRIHKIHKRFVSLRDTKVSTKSPSLIIPPWAFSNPLVFPVNSFIDSLKTYYIIMEDYGVALDTIERLVWDNAETVFLRTLLALKYLHDQNRLHCDVHAGNILMINKNYYSTVLVDLGSSQKINKHTLLYEGPTRGGRWDVMPPEQFSLGKGSSDVKLSCSSDIYAAAATFVHLVSGKYPFSPRGGKLSVHGCKDHELRSIEAMKRHILSFFPNSADKKLVDILIRALQPDPKLRFTNVDEIFKLLGINFF